MSIINAITLKEILCNNTERGFNLPFADLILHACIDIKLFAINVNNRHNNTERDFNLPFADLILHACIDIKLFAINVAINAITLKEVLTYRIIDTITLKEVLTYRLRI